MTIQHLRIGRPTDRLGEIVAFYRELFKLEVVAAFEDHEGFGGVMLRRPGDAFHLEFTHERGRTSPAPPSKEHLLVFYLEEDAWRDMQLRLESANVPSVSSHNPYWDRHGITFEDPDGNRIVVHHGRWEVERSEAEAPTQNEKDSARERE
ncbi:MAG: VOC family protein [Candidatus Eremiobacteraeota bacterium]|nr:VOC family protein [Candidatus Eremiobacteraeota bacterium]